MCVLTGAAVQFRRGKSGACLASCLLVVACGYDFEAVTPEIVNNYLLLRHQDFFHIRLPV
jgi:hypothetical protein